MNHVPILHPRSRPDNTSGDDRAATTPARHRRPARNARSTAEREASVAPAVLHIRRLAGRLAQREVNLEAHSRRMALTASILGVGLGLTELEIRMLRYGAYLHDVGKLAIAADLLQKAGPLNEEEWRVMRQHPVLGEQMCRGVSELEGTLPIIRSHHERWDGSGYPDGLSGETIPLLARITQVADIFDALTSERPYRRPDSPQQALATIQEETARGWRDPELVKHFERLFPLLISPPADAVQTYSLMALGDAVNRGQWA